MERRSDSIIVWSGAKTGLSSNGTRRVPQIQKDPEISADEEKNGVSARADAAAVN